VAQNLAFLKLRPGMLQCTGRQPTFTPSFIDTHSGTRPMLLQKQLQGVSFSAPNHDIPWHSDINPHWHRNMHMLITVCTHILDYPYIFRKTC